LLPADTRTRNLIQQVVEKAIYRRLCKNIPDARHAKS
jgi:hypothetical protein